MIKAIFWDNDGVLVDTERLYFLGTQRLLATVSVTLTTTNPGSTLLGLGIGIPGANIGGCDLTKTVQALPGSAAQLTASVEAGTYCAGAFDVGGVGRNGVLVTVSVAHP